MSFHPIAIIEIAATKSRSPALTAGAFSFRNNILAITPMVAIF
jgi:hypothetical protein